MLELVSLDATAQAQLVRNREIKPRELVEAAIERVERLNPKLNAVVTPMFDEAIEAVEGSLPKGPFQGVPFLLKDLTAEYAGVRLTGGSEFVGDYVSEEDSEIVTRFKKAGFVTVGKTNTPEFGLLPTTEPHRFGATRNPWDTKRSSGGSSGGSASAVSARLVPLAHGNDGGGSIRTPSSCCGLFGLKPTRARNPLGPKYGDQISGLVAEHVLTLSVRDSAAVLDAISGPAIGDPYWAPPNERPFLEEVGADPGKLKIAFTTQTPNDASVHEDCVAAVRNAAELCDSLGHEVEEFIPEVGLDPDALTQAFTLLFAADAAKLIDDWSRQLNKKAEEENFEPLTWAAADLGRSFNSGEYLQAVQDLQYSARLIQTSLSQYDLFLTPTLAEPPPELGSFEMEGNPLYGWVRAGMMIPFVVLANYGGLPAASVPLHWNDDGLPIGVQFTARFGDEATIFRLASHLEEARPWAERLPRVCA
ncbi:MAG: amidase [Actinobacteria bacterium]|nr:amidase [Actinomycetota bacterium]